jgi:hypothetical protein
MPLLPLLMHMIRHATLLMIAIIDDAIIIFAAMIRHYY